MVNGGVVMLVVVVVDFGYGGGFVDFGYGFRGFGCDSGV